VIVPTRILPFTGGLVGSAWLYDPFFTSAPYPYETDAPLYDSADAPGTDGPTGGLRLRVTPKSAQVFVDGYYAGVVDDFDGLFQHLTLGVGPHHVEVHASSFEPLAIDVDIPAHHTIVFRGVLRPWQRNP
jgi:hypothetical protein